MKKVAKERRKYQRYNTEMKIYFRVTYDIRTRLKFQILNRPKLAASRKYSGVTENINAEGLRFVASRKLKKNDLLALEIYVPRAKNPIRMEGEVRWSRKFASRAAKHNYHTGVKLLSVNNQPIADTVYYDSKYKVVWSAVLETVLSRFKTLVKRSPRRKAKASSRTAQRPKKRPS